MRVFLATNIILDVLMNRPVLVADSEAVILRCGSLNAEMFIAWHGLATAYYLLRRGRSESDALADVDQILDWARIAEPGDADARRARTLGFSDFEDALQAVSAEACNADYVITRNTSDFARSMVTPVLPREFLQRHPEPEGT